MTHQPITPQELRAKLGTGPVQFMFVKKDGSLRECHATTNLTHIPTDKHPLGVKQTPETQLCFWDLMVQDWRSLTTRTQIFINQ
jgi:hypothetical protein